MTSKYQTNGTLPGDPTLPPGCTLADLEREERDDEQWWTDYWMRRGGIEPEDKLHEQ